MRRMRLLRQQLPQHVLQDTAVLVVEHLLGRVDADRRLELAHRAVRVLRLDRDLPAGGEAGRIGSSRSRPNGSLSTKDEGEGRRRAGR